MQQPRATADAQLFAAKFHGIVPHWLYLQAAVGIPTHPVCPSGFSGRNQGGCYKSALVHDLAVAVTPKASKACLWVLGSPMAADGYTAKNYAMETYVKPFAVIRHRFSGVDQCPHHLHNTLDAGSGDMHCTPLSEASTRELACIRRTHGCQTLTLSTASIPTYLVLISHMRFGVVKLEGSSTVIFRCT